VSITIAEIAKLAGVSKATVSRVLNDKPDVLPETRKKIKDLIELYEYEPNAFAQAISNQKSSTIGMVIPHTANYIFSNPYYAEIMRGVSVEAKKNGYHLMLTYSEGEDYVSVVKQKRVDGIILISPGRKHKALVQKFDELGVPFVATSKLPGMPDISYVSIDDFHGSCMAVEHLINLGHRDIGFIGGPRNLASSEERIAGYKYTLDKYNISFNESFVSKGDTSIASGQREMIKLLENKELTAVFAAGDLMATGAIRAINLVGKGVPEDISIVGFDDVPLAEFLNPPLTTIKQYTYEKGQIAAKMLIDKINKKSVDDKIIMPVNLVVRMSTRAI
jgi:DNA-binding LacI/PurR family transcriptional regulator